MASKNFKGAKVDLASFQGEGRGDLPSGSSGQGFEEQRGYERQSYRSDRGDRGDRGERGEEGEASRADEARAWRSEGAGRQDSRGPPRSFGGDRDRGNDRDRRYGGFDDRQSAPRQERPAHLRFGRGATQDERVRRPAAIEDEEGEGEGPKAAPAPVNPRWSRPPADAESSAPQSVDADAEWRSFKPTERRSDFGNRGGDYGNRDRDFGRGGDRDRDSYGGGRFGDRGAAGGSSFDAAREARFAARAERDGGGGGGGRFQRPPAEDDDRGYGNRERGDRDGYSGGDYRSGRGGDSRPAHLRFGGRAGGPGSFDRPSEFDPLPSAPAHKLQAKMEDAREAQRKGKNADKQAAPKVAQPIERSEDAYAENLHVPVVPVSQKLTPLEKAIAERMSIDEKELADSLSRMDLEEEEVENDAGDVLARSLIDGKLTLKEIFQQAGQMSGLLLATLSAYKQKKSDRELLALVKGSEVDAVAMIAPGVNGKALTDFLTEKNLLVLAPIPDLSKDIDAQFKAGASSEAMVKAIDAAVDPKVSVNNLTTIVSTNVYGRVLADKAKANVDELKAFKPLLARVLDDQQSQMDSLFILQNLWFKAGAVKGTIKEAFMALLDLEILPVEAFFAWRDDTKQKGAAKTKALLQVNAWLTEITPKRKVEKYSDDEDGDEDDEDGEDDEDEDDDGEYDDL